MPASLQFSLKITALLTINVFIMDNYLIVSPGSTTAKCSLNLLSHPIFVTICATKYTAHKAHFTSTETRHH